jgi:hypothetical protein
VAKLEVLFYMMKRVSATWSGYKHMSTVHDSINSVSIGTYFKSFHDLPKVDSAVNAIQVFILWNKRMWSDLVKLPL